MIAEVLVRAPAKINLGLEVLHKRDDGFHEMRTVLQTIRLSDRLRIRASRPAGKGEGRITLTVSASRQIADLGPADENLVVRAARGYRDSWRGPANRDGAAGGEAPLDLSFELTKRIPVGAGLGGGSSDAAATLVGLAALLGPLDPDPSRHRERVRSLAAALGSDVPFFLDGGTQLGTGRGEVVEPIPPWPGGPLAVVYPNVSLPTSSIYRRVRLPLTPPGPLARMSARDFSRGFWEPARRELRNDLQDAVVAESPDVGKLLASFEALGSAFARVTGSGSAVFGVASSMDEARRWAERFRGNGCWARATGPARSGCRLLSIARS
ncbi:MAG: 4-(cytidine 5'-diphospho)-2-C-methyl-D-erythritol kinase [Candidatus Eisenbacteria bacterium]